MNHTFPLTRHGVLAHYDAQSKEGFQLRRGGRHRLASRWSYFEFRPMTILSHIPCLHTQREEN